MDDAAKVEDRCKLVMTLLLVWGICGTAFADPTPNTMYIQDGFGFSGAYPVDSTPIGENIEMIDYDAWPGDFEKGIRAFAGGVFDGEYIWMIPSGADRVIKIHKDSGVMEGYDGWPDGTQGSDANKFIGGVYDGTYVWMVPSAATQVIRVSSNGDMVGYDDWPIEISSSSQSKFRGGVYDGNAIWLIPSNVEALVKLDITVGENHGVMTAYTDWPEGINIGDGNQFSGAVFDGTYIWIIPANATQVVRVHKDSGAMEGYGDWPVGYTLNAYSNFQGGFYDGEHVWLSPAEAPGMLKVSQYGNMEVVNSIKGYYGGGFDGESIWLVPLGASDVARHHIASGEVTTYSGGYWPSGYIKGGNAFNGGVFDGKSLWLIPLDADRVIKIQTAVPKPDLTIETSEDGDFAVGGTGSYIITVTNSGDAATSDVVNVTNTLPAGLTATSIDGDGWDCELDTLTCMRDDILAAGEDYPDITLAVDVTEQAASIVTNTAVVDGGGETVTNNNTSYSYTTISRSYTIEVSQTEKLIFDSQRVGYGLIDALSVTITQTGTGDISNLHAGIVEDTKYFTLGMIAPNLTGDTSSTTLTIIPNLALPAGKYTNTVSITADNGVSESFEIEFTVTRRVTQTEVVLPVHETITVNVEDTGAQSGGVVHKVEISRTVKPDGTKKDEVALTAEQVKQTVESIQQAGSSSASIVIPDDKDEVSEVSVSIPQDAQRHIVDANIDFGISTDNAKVIIPNASLQGFDEDLYFNFIPIKDDEEKHNIQVRADSVPVVRVTVGDNEFAVVGRPMTIDTNMQSRPVTLIMPLRDVDLDEAELNELRIFIEHSDGTKELIHGELVSFSDDGTLGLRFEVNKFSTFSLLRIDNKVTDEEPAVEQETDNQTHTAYIRGYSDGTFRPENTITRAEIAAILSRVVDLPETAADRVYGDVAASHWAQQAIADVTRMGLMQGYEDGAFRPDSTISRAEMATLVEALVDDDASSAAAISFPDVAGHWAEASIGKAQRAGLISGYETGLFAPNQSLTRAEAVVIMNKVLARTPHTVLERLPWSDVSDTHWAVRDIAEASVDHEF